MRMARVNVYLPDDLARQVRDAGLNVSSVAQDALVRALAATRLDEWLNEVAAMPSAGVSHRAVIEAVEAAKEEFSGRG